MAFEFSIARRLYGQRSEGHRLSRPAVQIAMWGVAVGLAVMILSVCIILGFKGEIRQKVIGFGGHIEVINYRSLYNVEAQPIVI
ncbi:MAG: ABC transporter permease, partial [Bacteroidales bacterium]|nr:ABC transporter permease [Bacteroidales bacterium]